MEVFLCLTDQQLKQCLWIHMEIFQLLNKSNCRKCNEATCLAFAAAVFNGQKQLDECPHLEREIIERYGGKAANQTTLEQEADTSIAQLKSKVATMDLSLSAIFTFT